MVKLEEWWKEARSVWDKLTIDEQRAIALMVTDSNASADAMPDRDYFNPDTFKKKQWRHIHKSNARHVQKKMLEMGLVSIKQ